MAYGLGVDLGASSIAAAISRDGVSEMVPLGKPGILMPSIVQMQTDGTLLAGEPDPVDSPSMAAPTLTGLDFKRRLGHPAPLVLGGQPHSAVSLLAATLGSVVETVTGFEGEPPDRIVITYPSVWGAHRREQFDGLLQRAGMNTVSLVAESVAAATYYSSRQPLAEGDILAVYDLGGGTFEASLTRMTGSGLELHGTPDGVDAVGGMAFDEAIFSHLDSALDGMLTALDPNDPESAWALRRVREQCVEAKVALSQTTSIKLAVVLPNWQGEVRLTRGDFENMIRESVEATVAAVRRTIESAGLTPDDLTGVLLVGGSSRIALICRALNDELSLPLLTGPNPHLWVARGAALIAEAPSGGAVPALDDSADQKDPDNRDEEEPDEADLDRGDDIRRVIAGVAAAVVSVSLVIAGCYLAFSPTLSGSGSNDPPLDIPIPSATGTPRDTADPTGAENSTAERTTNQRSTAERTSARLTSGTGFFLGLGRKCLAAAPDDDGDNAVQINGCNGTQAQSWSVKDGTIRAIEKCLDVHNTDDGRRAYLTECDGTDDQLWELASGRVINVGWALCLDVVGQSAADLTPVTISRCRDADGQDWVLQAS